MYLEYYGLKEPPFDLTPNPRFLFFSAKHREAFNHLLYGIRERKGFVVAHENFCWLTEKTNPDEAAAEQKEHVLRVVSDERPWDYIQAVYLTGTVDDIQRRIQERIDIGVEHLFIHTMTPDLSQLELFAKHLLDPFKDVEPGRKSALS